LCTEIDDKIAAFLNRPLGGVIVSLAVKQQGLQPKHE
jgi:hypothetical protein